MPGATGIQARIVLDGPAPPACTIKALGAPTVIVCGQVASCIGDTVDGPVPAPPGPFTGVTETVNPSTVILQGRPAARCVVDGATGIVQVPSPAGPVPTPVPPPGLPLMTFPSPPCTVIVG